MNNNIKKYSILFMLFIYCFVFENVAYTAKTLETKVLPITPNSYRKTPETVKKAVKKTETNNSKNSTNSSSSKSKNQIKDNSTTKSSKTKDTKIVSNSSLKINNKQSIKEEKTARRDRIKEPIIKVKLGANNCNNVKVVFPNGGQITNSKGKRISNLKNNQSFTWSLPSSNKNSKKKNKIEHLNDILTFKPNKDIFVFNGDEYRGKLTLKITEKGAIAVNEIYIEDYLRGVVGREIGASSPGESLKAQSVIARTYAYSNRGKHGNEGADVCSTTHCQVYFGKSAERESVDKAIKDTRGYILTYNSKPISALYHATCGGMTSNNEEVWGGTPEPFLRRVNCDFCLNGTKYRWNQEISTDKLRSDLAKEGVKLAEIYGVSIEAPAKMDRVSNMVFQTKNGEQKIRGTTVRRIFNLPSTTFILGDKNERANIIANAKKDNYSNSKFNENVYITTFASDQAAPKQLLVYTSRGLKRAILPADGWKIISYKALSKGIANFGKNDDNKDIKSVKDKLNKRLSNKVSKEPISKIKLFGRGFGHQVGLCQSGAVEMGKKGWNYRQILAHYYQGVALKNLGY